MHNSPILITTCRCCRSRFLGGVGGPGFEHGSLSESCEPTLSSICVENTSIASHDRVADDDMSVYYSISF